MAESAEVLKPGHGLVVDYVLFGQHAEHLGLLRREMVDNPDLSEVRQIILSEPGLEEASQKPVDLDDDAHARSFSIVRSAMRLLLDTEYSVEELRESKTSRSSVEIATPLEVIPVGALSVEPVSAVVGAAVAAQVDYAA